MECSAPAVTAFRLDHLSVRRGHVDVLQDISLTIPAGSITAIVGRSGVGKTTLIHSLTGLIAPSAGTIHVAGIGAIDDPQALRQHRRHSATIFQDHALIDRLPAIDNVLLGLADLRHPLSFLPWQSSLRRRACEALDDVGLLHRASTRVAHLSGGERQRVGIARALVRRPRLLLGDEPFASVDPALVRSLDDEIRRLVARSGLTVVLVLHQIELARAIADRIIGLVDGRVAFDAPAAEFGPLAQALVFNSLRPVATTG